ncbi:hypothetical protein [Deinococcus sp.]|uniref:hypothetical protein n=1 Tax=Deinococcus sp. TaxID=47478 RepID=UPI003B5B5A44
MKVFIFSLVALINLTSCWAKPKGILMNDLTELQVLNHLGTEFKDSDKYKLVECDKFFKRPVSRLCFLTNLPPLGIEPVLKKFEIEGLEILQDWQTTGAATNKIFKLVGRENYRVTFLFSPIDNPVNAAHKDSGYQSVLTLYVSTGY